MRSWATGGPDSGIDAWEKAGLPLVRGRRFSMERQVRMAVVLEKMPWNRKKA